MRIFAKKLCNTSCGLQALMLYLAGKAIQQAESKPVSHL